MGLMKGLVEQEVFQLFSVAELACNLGVHLESSIRSWTFLWSFPGTERGSEIIW